MWRRRDDRGDDDGRGIAFGAYDVVVAGGVEHMGRHPMGEGVDPNRGSCPRSWWTSRDVHGHDAENLHDRFPRLTQGRADEFAVRRPGEGRQGVRERPDPAGLVADRGAPDSPEAGETGWGLATADEPMRPGTTLESWPG